MPRRSIFCCASLCACACETLHYRHTQFILEKEPFYNSFSLCALLFNTGRDLETPLPKTRNKTTQILYGHCPFGTWVRENTISKGWQVGWNTGNSCSMTFATFHPNHVLSRLSISLGTLQFFFEQFFSFFVSVIIF